MNEKENQSAETTTNSGVSEIADTNENEKEFTDSSEAENTTNDSLKTEIQVENVKQKTNSDYARERRKAERERDLKRARFDAIKETLNGINPYTQEEIKDDYDMEEYLVMKEMEKQGKDPVYDYSKFLKDKKKAEQEVIIQRENQEEWIKNDKQEFVNKYPDVDLSELINDDLFKAFASGKVGKMSMSKIYSDYSQIIKKIEDKATLKTSQILANNASTPGKLSSTQEKFGKSIKDMSKTEFEKMVERVKRGERF